MELPEERALRWLVSRYARVWSASRHAIGSPEMIEPNGKYFPDEFTNDGESVGRMLRRMVSYAPLSGDLEIALTFREPEEGESGGGGGGGCGSGACGTGEKISPNYDVVDQGDGYVIQLRTSDVSHPHVLAAALSRSVGAIVLSEAEEEATESEAGAMSEIAAAVCGFGVLLTNGAAVYAKGCGGLRMQRATYLSVEEQSVLLALFVRMHGKKVSAARAHMETTQREAFDMALSWVDSNDDMVARLREAPELLADGVFDICMGKGFFERLFGRKKSSDEPSFVRKESAPKSEEEARRIAETRALVDEALGE